MTRARPAVPPLATLLVTLAATLVAPLAGCTSEPPPPAPVLPEPFHLNGYEQTFGYAQAVRVDRTLYVSASLPVDHDGRLVAPGDLAGQLDAAYANLRATLHAHGAGFEHVIAERIYVTDMDAYLKVADRRFDFYPRTWLPASTVLEVRRLVDPGFLIAVEATAELPVPPPDAPVRP